VVYSEIAKARYRRYSGRRDERREPFEAIGSELHAQLSGKFDNKHDWRAVDAAPVESWILSEARSFLVR